MPWSAEDTANNLQIGDVDIERLSPLG